MYIIRGKVNYIAASVANLCSVFFLREYCLFVGVPNPSFFIDCIISSFCVSGMKFIVKFASNYRGIRTKKVQRKDGFCFRCV